MSNASDPISERDLPSELADTNSLLAEWAACSAEQSSSLIDRFEALGYEVRSKSREEVAEVLKHPPTCALRP